MSASTRNMELRSRHFTDIYEDDRYKEKYAFHVRHEASIEVIRASRKEDLLKQMDALRKAGYRIHRFKKTRKR